VHDLKGLKVHLNDQFKYNISFDEDDESLMYPSRQPWMYIMKAGCVIIPVTTS
jgi:hypothetical protein